jgi:HSP20 family protein
MRDSRGPFHGFIDTLAEMSRMREQALGGGEERTQATAWVPTTDILVRGDDLIIRCELAGVANDDVEVTLANGTLWIWGERMRPPEDDVALPHPVTSSGSPSNGAVTTTAASA